MQLKLTPKLNLRLYGLLLVITPFLLLQNYLQDAMGKLSRLEVSGFPIFVIFVIIALLLAAYILYRNYTHIRLWGMLIVIFLFWVGYNTSDYYFNHHFYDIQHNWHYFAYGIFSWLAWSHYSSKGNTIERIILYTFLMAIFLSLMDEIIQVFISNRIFDLSDVGKDLWGCMIGQIFIQVVIFNMKHLSFDSFWQKGMKKWVSHGTYLLSIQLIFAWVFLNVASILTDDKYAGQVVFITLIIFLFLAFLFQAARKKPGRYVVIGIMAILILYPVIRLTTSEAKVKYLESNIVIYKGVPVPYFDVMIYPNGMMRPVDKKTGFNSRDKNKINEIGADILILGTGSKNIGGKGYQDQLRVEMQFNPIKKKMYQIIKLPNKEACKEYNRLKKQGKKILMIIHNS